MNVALLTPQPRIERRVLAEVIVNELALALADDLETDDFAVAYHRFTFQTLRNLQATKTPIGVLEIADAIAMDDLRLETFLSHTVDIVWLVDLLFAEPAYGDLLDPSFVLDLRVLRRIAEARRAAMRAA